MIKREYAEDEINKETNTNESRCILKETLRENSIGRIICFDLIRKEKSILEAKLNPIEDKPERAAAVQSPDLTYNEKYFLEKQLQYLEEQEIIQNRYRKKFAKLANGPRIPKEIIRKILSLILSHNKLKYLDYPSMTRAVYVDGLPPYAVLDPTLLLPHYSSAFRVDWTLADITRQEMKRTVLDEASLVQYIELRVEEVANSLSRDHQLLRYPHRWKKLLVRGTLSLREFNSAFRSSPSRLKELTMLDGCILDVTIPISDALEFNSLENVWIHSHFFITFFNSGIRLTSLKRLTLNWLLSPEETHSIIRELVCLLSQLTRLEELTMLGFGFQCKNSLHDVPRVKSTALRSLNIDGPGTCAVSSLFSDCNIQCVEVCCDYLEELEEFFPNVNEIRIGEGVPETLYERKQDGSLAFPNLDHLTLILHWREEEITEEKNHLLRTVRTRAGDSSVRSIKCLCFLKWMVTDGTVTDVQFQEELERYVPSLVLPDYFH